MKVSVIIPVYNVEPYLAECLDSVLAQTLRDIEVVCVDDGSTDGSGRMLDEYAARDSRVKVIHQTNAGVGKARNAGMDAAGGEFIAFMDPDDMYPDNGVLNDLYRAAVENGASVCGGSFMEFLPNGAERTKYDGDMGGMKFDRDGFINYRDWQFDFGFYRFIYRREMLTSRNIRFPDYIRYQDPPFFVRAMAAAERFYALMRVAYKIRISRTEIDWRGRGAARFKALCTGIYDVARFARDNGYGQLLLLQRRRVEADFADVFEDETLCSMARRQVRKLFILLGFRLRRWRWRLLPWSAPSSLAGVKEIMPKSESAEERVLRLYAGDLANFGRAYADGMAELRRKEVANA